MDLLEFFESVVRISIPLIFAALGGYFSEKSGVVQIALEAWMLVGAFVAAAFTIWYSSGTFGFFAGGITAGVFCMLYALLTVRLSLDQVVCGIAMNLLAAGAIPLVGKFFFGHTGGTGTFESKFLVAHWPPLLALFLVIGAVLLTNNSRWGLRLRFAGEAPVTLRSAGFSVGMVRVQALFLCGMLAGFGGACLSVYLSTGYSRNMVAGRGFMALAALILGKWKPLPTAIGCLFWGFLEASQNYLQSSEWVAQSGFPISTLQLLPYVFTIIVLAGFVGRAQMPSALGKDS